MQIVFPWIWFIVFVVSSFYLKNQTNGKSHQQLWLHLFQPHNWQWWLSSLHASSCFTLALSHTHIHMYVCCVCCICICVVFGIRFQSAIWYCCCSLHRNNICQCMCLYVENRAREPETSKKERGKRFYVYSVKCYGSSMVNIHAHSNSNSNNNNKQNYTHSTFIVIVFIVRSHANQPANMNIFEHIRVLHT